MTGWGMAGHAQALELSTHVHATFGYTLMSAAFARIVEISFVLRDKPCLPDGRISTFQHLPPYLLVASGYIFMCANEEQLMYINELGIDHVSYLLNIYALAFFTYTYANVLVLAFLNTGVNRDQKIKLPPYTEQMNGNGHTVTAGAEITNQLDLERARDAEEFELSALIDSEDEEDHDARH